MITPIEAQKVDEYLTNMYSPTKEDLDYLDKVDNLICECVADNCYAYVNSDKLFNVACSIYETMKSIFETDCGVSPRLLQYQERYLQLMTLYAKVNELDDMYIDNLALLCFVSSFDLYFLQHSESKGKTI